MTKVKLKIDGKDVLVNENTTILQAARSAGIRIPTLCYHERLNPIGSCKLCVVEINGSAEPVESCATPVAKGMVVKTSSERLFSMRQEALKRLLVHHPMDCPVCDKAGECTLQDLVFEFGIKADEYAAPEKRTQVSYATPLIKYWADRCVYCQRCATACKEIKGAEALSFKPIDGRLQLTVDTERCVSCGECMQVCPTGALTENVSHSKGRAFLVEKVPTTCSYCGCGCQMELNVLDNKVVSVNGRHDAGGNKGSLCVKGRFGYEFIASEQRLTKPLIKKDGEFVEAEWDEALRLIARKFSQIKSENGPDSIGGFSSARCTNEENFIFQKFMRAVIGTNNVDHCARL